MFFFGLEVGRSSALYSVLLACGPETRGQHVSTLHVVISDSTELSQLNFHKQHVPQEPGHERTYMIPFFVCNCWNLQTQQNKSKDGGSNVNFSTPYYWLVGQKLGDNGVISDSTELSQLNFCEQHVPGRAHIAPTFGCLWFWLRRGRPV